MRSSVPAVVQAFAIMRLLGDKRALTLSEVANACSISPSSCLGLLRTLVGEGVLQLNAGKRYALSPSWQGIGGVVRDDEARLIVSARPLLATAAGQWQAPVGLWRAVSRDRLQLVALGESLASTRIHMEEGQRQPIGSGAVGRAFAAAQRVSPAEIARRFAAIRWQRPVSLDEYAFQIATAASGHGRDDELSFPGIVSLAVALPGEPCTFCLSVSVFAGSRTEDELAGLAKALGQLARTVAMQVPPEVSKTG